MRSIIGLSGYARSGKDSVANVLAEECGYTVVRFADKLRESLLALNPLVGPGTTLSEVIEMEGWDGYKNTPYESEIRWLMQRMGTEAGRDIHGENLWVDALFRTVEKRQLDRVVIPDTRFMNEILGIKMRNGVVWRINRPGVGPRNLHASETEAAEYNDFDAVIANDGSLDTLASQVRALHSRMPHATI